MLSWLSAYLRTVYRERTWDQEFVEILSKENIKKTVCCSDEEFNSSDMEMFKQEFQHLSLQEYLESFEELDVQLKGLKEGIIMYPQANKLLSLIDKTTTMFIYVQWQCSRYTVIIQLHHEPRPSIMQTWYRCCIIL